MSTVVRRRPSSRQVWWRRAWRLSQAAFLLLFLYLVLWTRQGVDRLPAYSLFFRLDPLAGLAATLAARRWIAGLGLGVLTIALTLVAGRAWCGWICPLGTLLDLMPSRRTRAGQDLGATWRAVKYGILALIVTGGLAGSITLMVLDPITLLTRAIASFVLPLADALIHAVEVALVEVEPLQDAVYAFDAWLRRTILPAQPAFVAANTAVGVLLVLVLAANAIRRRFWCRTLCPLGGLLGLISRVSLFRHSVNQSACVSCGRCASACPTGAIVPESDYRADSAECIACMECLVACPTRAVSFPRQPILPAPMPYDPSRRQTLTMLGVAIAGVGLLRVARWLKVPDRWLVRPPGATEASLSQCVRCGQCLKVCPTGGLQPSLTTAGIEGLWTPVLMPRQGYCNYGCASCGQVCPTGAIPSLDLAVKREMVLGLAVVDRDRCLAWHDNQQCIVCEEMCPVPDKAITLDDITVIDGDGYEVLIRRPVVIDSLCIGCGSCEWHCPVVGDSAIRVQYSPLAGQPRASAGAATQMAPVAVAPTAVPSATEEIAVAAMATTTPVTQPSATPTATAAPTETPVVEVATTAPEAVSGPLVVYFSRTGNTREIARQIHDLTGGEMLEIKPVVPYPDDHNECTQVAARELRENDRPAIQPLPADLDRFDTVFLGYPNWWGTIPMAVATFLESQAWAGRTVIPFCTHLGSRLGRSVADLQVLCAGATIRDGLDVRGTLVYEAQATVAAWVAGLGLIE